jgi:hypothetical protein
MVEIGLGRHLLHARRLYPHRQSNYFTSAELEEILNETLILSDWQVGMASGLGA